MLASDDAATVQELLTALFVAASAPRTIPSVLLAREHVLHTLVAYVMILVGWVVIVVEVGLGAHAPYGRHGALPSARRFGPLIPAKLAWAFQESWAFLIPVALLLSSPESTLQRFQAAPEDALLLSMFMGHYAYRAFVFPLRMRGGKSMRIGICFLAALFCLVNGYLQGRTWTASGGGWPLQPRRLDSAASVTVFAAGVALWALGLWVNLHADHVLRMLRKPGETGYRIPHGGAFTLVSGANYFGEIVEWCGYAMASGGALPAVAFAFFTFANTAPRAHHHHLWYREKFEDYPRERRAVIPFIW